MQIHQVLPALSYGDAASNHAIEIMGILRGSGFSSNIYAKYIHPKVSTFAKPLDMYKKNAANIVIYHLSLAGLDVSDFVRRLPDKKVLIYHNVTPHHYFKGINDTLYDLCKRGREELKLFDEITKLALGVSEYSRRELEQYGFKDTGVLPIILDYTKYAIPPDEKTMRAYATSDYVNLLFVGRIAPNKRIDDLIKIFYYHKKINLKSRLFIVGSYEGMENHFARLQELVKKLGLTDVVFTGLVSFEELIAYYRMADVFICMSEHEGFCVPLLESMYFHIPIIAYNATAVPYTLANCGVLVNEKRYDEIAEMVQLLITDKGLRKRILEVQNERLKDFEWPKLGEQLRKYIEQLNNSTETVELPLKHKFAKYPLVSIVICTYNRAHYLERCIKSLKKQTYPNFEMIVVNGPSTDETNQVLYKYPEIQVVRQKELNGLSFARNLGIAASNGEIIAFIDDDAVADENWIMYLVAGYTDDSVGGVGGLVYGPQKTHLQFDRGTINKCAIPTAIRDKDMKLRKDEFSIIMGTNSSFRKEVLYEVDGFDPYFRYYHDESDLCVRIAKKGYRIVYQREASVIHDMLEGHNRNSHYDLNWTEIMKNVIYFTLKNFRSEFSSYIFRPVKSLYWWLKYFTSLYLNKDISLKQLFGIYLKLVKGAMKGYNDGIKVRENKNNFADITTPDGKIKLKICFLSQEFAKNCNGGVCRYTYDLAHALAELGNEVHVITKSERNREYEYRDGDVFVHKIVPEPMDFLGLSEDMYIAEKNLSYSYSAGLKLLELIDKFGIQIVEGPLWDGEGFVFSLVNPIPLVVRLETPLFKVAEIQRWQMTKDLKFVNWMEGETVRRAEKAIAISKDIGTLIGNHHTISSEKIELCPLGIEVPDESLLLRDKKKKVPDVLFVGRLEKRKGVETLFKAIPIVLEEVPDAQFHIVGKDTNLTPNGGSYREFLLQNLGKKYHKNVWFVGYVDDNELKDFYRNCDIFVAPSLYESFGLIYLEAMAWGKPVIGCDAGGAREVIMNGKTGYLVPPDTPGDLANAIIDILSDDELGEKMGINARKRVEETYTSEIMAKETLEVYKKLVNDTTKKSLEYLGDGFKLKYRPSTTDIGTINKLVSGCYYELLKEIKDNDIVIDIGAHIGTFSILACRCAKDVKVYAYEPFPDNFQMLKQNIALNGLENNIIIFNKAVWRSNCRKKISIYRDDIENLGSPSLYFPSDWEGIIIDCITPEQIFESNRIAKECILKLDCEGCEFDVLFNMPQKYLKLIKCIGMEYHCQLGPNDDPFENKIKLKKYLEDSGFNVAQGPDYGLLGFLFCFKEANKRNNNEYYGRAIIGGSDHD